MSSGDRAAGGLHFAGTAGGSGPRSSVGCGPPRNNGRSARLWAVDRFDWSSLAAEAAELFGIQTIDEMALSQFETAVA